MFYLQERDISTGQWCRMEDEGPFDTPLAALERRDEIAHNLPNDGLQSHRGYRAVDEGGNVLEYEEKRVAR